MENAELTQTDLVTSLRNELARCSQERTDSATLAVRLQDEIGQLTTERRLLIRGLRHLYEHLTTGAMVIDTPGKACSEIHEGIKPYLLLGD
jgi:hypothetical protein